MDAVINLSKLLEKWKCEEINITQSQDSPCAFYKCDYKYDLILTVRITVDSCAITLLETNAEYFANDIKRIFNIIPGGST